MDSQLVKMLKTMGEKLLLGHHVVLAKLKSINTTD